MTVDERSRLQLAEALKRALGDDEGITLMELLPPVGWADVATRHDLGSLRQELVAFEGRMDARFAVIDARFESLEGRFDAKLDGLEGRVDARFETLEHRLDARFEKGFRQIVVTMMSLFITGFVATIIAVALR